jgi:hypothetical protein
MTRVPNLFIVGAPKSGSTSLYEYLREHPDVFMSAVKEPCYFAADLALDKSGNFMRYGQDEKLYFDLFSEAGDAKVAGEASTRYLYSQQAPRLIHGIAAEARIVAVLRNPVDMMHSLHAHKMAAGTEDIADFEQALAAEDDRHAGQRIPPFSNPKLATYTDRARFGEQVERWIATFGRERVRVMIFEEMVADPALAFRRLLEFLGIDPDFQPSSFAAHNVAHDSRSPTLRRVLNSRVPQWVAWRLMPRVIGDLPTRTLVRRFSQGTLQRRQIERAALSPELRRRLEAELAPDVKRLSQLLGRDMSLFWFGRPAVNAPLDVADSRVISASG